MSVIVPILYVLLFVFLIYKVRFFTIPELSRNTIPAIFILKVIAGVALFLVYTHYYSGGDVLDYYNGGKKMHDQLVQHPLLFLQSFFQFKSYKNFQNSNNPFGDLLYNDAYSMIVINAILHFFSFGYFHVHMVVMSFLSLIGLTALYKTFLPYFINQKKLLLVIIFFIPSVLFWSSGVLKESPLFLGLGLLLYATNCGYRTSYNWKKIVLVVFSLMILLLVKYYVLIALLPSLLLNMWVSKTSEKLVAIKYLSLLVVFFLGVVLSAFINPDYNFLNIIANKQARAISEAKGGVFLENEKHFVCVSYEQKSKFLQLHSDNSFTIKNGSNYLLWQQNNMRDTTFVQNSLDTAKYRVVYEVVPAKTVLELNRLNTSFKSFLRNAPTALFNVLLQPFIWNVKGIIQLLPALENIFFIVLLVLSMVFFDKKNKKTSLVLFCVSFVVLLYVLIGFTIPVIGSLVRYKVPALPFLCIGLFLLMDKKKFANAFPVIAKWLA